MGTGAVHPNEAECASSGGVQHHQPPPQVEQAPRKGVLQMLHSRVSSFIYRLFHSLGCVVTDRPGTTMAVCVFITAVCCSGFAFLTSETRPEYLYTPQDTESFSYRDLTKKYFLEEAIPIQVYVEPVSGASLLSQEALQELLKLHQEISSASVLSDDGDLLTYQDACARVGDGCFNQSVLQHWDFQSSRIASDSDLEKTFRDSMAQMEFPNVVVTMNEDAGEQGGKPAAWLMSYAVYYYSGDVDRERATKSLVLEIHETINGFPRDVIRSSGFSQYYLDQEADRAISSDIKFVSIGYAALNTFTSLSFLRLNRIHDLSFNGSLSLMSIAMALASAYGLAAALGAPFSQAVSMLPFLLVGIGVDDAFIIIGELRNTDPYLRLPLKERISRSLGKSGAAVLVTSMTDFLAFMAGMGSAVPAIRHASLYAAFGAVFDFLYQVTFFVAGLVYKGRTQEAQRSFPLCCLPVSDAAKDTVCINYPGRPPRKYDPGAPLPMEVVARSLAHAVLHPIGRVLVIATGIAITAVAAWQVPKVETNFNYEWFAAQDSPIRDAIAIRNAYFVGPAGAASIVTQQADYFSPSAREQLLDFDRELSESGFLVAHFFWFRKFYNDVLQPAKFSGNDLTADIAQYYAALCEYDQTRPIATVSLAWGMEGAKLDSCTDRNLTDAAALEADPPIIASMIELIMANDGTSAMQVEQMNQAKSLANRLPAEFNAYAYHYSFLIYEGYEVFKFEILKTSIIACICVFCTTLFMLADTLSALQVFMCVLAVEVWLVGFMGMVGFAYNAVTCLNIVFSIGLAVDFTMHITHAYLHSSGTLQQRAHHALRTMGPSIINGALSTQIGLLGMAGASSYVFRVFFLMFTATTVSGAFFGLAFMPALLSFVGSSVSGTDAGHFESSTRSVAASHGDDSLLDVAEKLMESNKVSSPEATKSSDDDAMTKIPAQQAMGLS